MALETGDDDPRVARARGGDRGALAELLEEQAPWLRRWVESRMDARLRARASTSDVVQDVYLSAEKRLAHFGERPELTFPVWTLLVARQALVDLGRRHLGPQRDPGREAGAAFDDGPEGIAARIAGDLTSPSGAAIKREDRERLVRAIKSLDPTDREVLVLRHFDELTNDEVAKALGLTRGAASKRYVRALERLREVLDEVPGLAGQGEH